MDYEVGLRVTLASTGPVLEVSNYIKALESARDELMDAGFIADVRGGKPHTIGSFLFAQSPTRSVEISTDAGSWFVEFWRADLDSPYKESSFCSLPEAVAAARDWLVGLQDNRSE